MRKTVRTAGALALAGLLLGIAGGRDGAFSPFALAQWPAAARAQTPAVPPLAAQPDAQPATRPAAPPIAAPAPRPAALQAPAIALALSEPTGGGTEDKALADSLRAASLIYTALAEGRSDAQDIFAAAQADYARLVSALYARGHYGGSVSIRLDGREAATIGPFQAPERIALVVITVDPGPAFVFGTAKIAPLAADTRLPEGFAPGRPAPSPLIAEAATAAITRWRAVGHPTARVQNQSLRADHARARLNAEITLAPGPEARFGRLSFAGSSGVRPARLAKIAGFPSGRRFNPAELEDVIERLRRTGVFSAISTREAETVGPDGTLDVEITLVDQPRRRLGFGAEISNGEGVNLSAYLINRNLLNGAERLRLDLGVSQIAAPGALAPDARFGIAIDRPATITPDTTLGLSLDLRREEDGGLRRNILGIEGRLSHIISHSASVRGGLAWTVERADETLPLVVAQQTYRTLALPLGLTWDRRDNRLNARRGHYAEGEAALFRSYAGEGTDGVRLALDLRAYRPLVAGVTLAGRLRGGAVLEASWAGTPREYLFRSGGAGTVRGQPFEALAEPLCRDLLPEDSGGCSIGGTHFLGASAEVRAPLRGTLGAVAFADYGRIGVGGLDGASALWHAGAGVGLRYDTGVGPIRLDLAGPLGRGDTTGGLQVYLGIGQAF